MTESRDPETIQREQRLQRGDDAMLGMPLGDRGAVLNSPTSGGGVAAQLARDRRGAAGYPLRDLFALGERQIPSRRRGQTERWHAATFAKPSGPDRHRHAARHRGVLTRKAPGNPHPEPSLHLAAADRRPSRRNTSRAFPSQQLPNPLVVPSAHLLIEVLRRSLESAQYTSWAFGQRLRDAGLLGSMGSVGDALDNAVSESFFATLQTELLDRRSWATRADLANAIFEYVECFYNPHRRHSSLQYLSPIDYESRHHDQQPRIAA